MINETARWLVSAGLLLAVLGGCSGGALSPAGHDGAVAGADGGDAVIGTGGDGATACLQSVSPGAQCDVGVGCPALNWPATCDCEAGHWHCRLSICDTQEWFRSGADCPYLEPPAGCACAAQFNPYQGNVYCFCTVTDAGTGD